MTKGELITRLKNRTGLTKQQLSQIVFIPVHRKRKKSDEKLPRIKFKLSQVIRQKMIEEEKKRRKA